MKHCRKKVCHRKGKGFFGNLARAAGSALIPVAAGTAASLLGGRVHRRRGGAVKRRKGKGVLDFLF